MNSKVKFVSPKPMKHACPGGSRCCLDPYMQHDLCICSDPTCHCHSRERYEPGYVNRKERVPWR